jgi:asparagine N-glycosylation enzyme membrane subunit Stt3
MSNIAWPDMLDSAIWLPLVILFLIRALRSPQKSRAVLFSCIAGLALGISVLGGRIHMVMMDAFVVLSNTFYMTWRRTRISKTRNSGVHYGCEILP